MSHDSVRDNPYTRGIARFVSGLNYDDIPDEVRERIKLLILDSFGCALYAPHLEWSQIPVSYTHLTLPTILRV